MAEITPDTHPDALIAELPSWNDGRGGVTARNWVGMMGRYDLAVGYSLVFWPRFVRFDGYVLREESFDEANLRAWEQAHGDNPQGIEAALNHLHIVDLHGNDETLTEAQALYLGRTLKSVWSAKLAADFPELAFEVAFDDTPGQGMLDYEVTFWQLRGVG
ncbi:hypothetical protein GVN21_15835 [Caulobacter sp. SLTY]|uniref:hypothetical protein n=1 Tax=Caulobacter sp. SLTY TaxID=2683262 RepID=UPI001411D68C|nr:hypothetical protein [Caulobacter sp. SLTY]NBB16835.1 hypothetical protein [Caulobacter sp. SLTY]